MDKVVYLQVSNNGTPWVAPDDFNPSDNQVDCISGGGGVEDDTDESGPCGAGVVAANGR
jgi:hypothetical protein